MTRDVLRADPSSARPVLPRSRYILIRLGPVAVRAERRSVLVCVALVAAVVVLGAVSISIGDYPLTAAELLRGLLGVSGDPLADYFVREVRLPRVIAAVLIGAALGVSGGIFQPIAQNPLGSPDIIGFTVGAASGALLQIILFDGGPLAIGLGAILGGFGTAALVYLLAWRDGLSGYRLVLVGIGIAAVLQAVNALLVVRASLDRAQTAVQWLAGSLNATSWAEVGLLTVALAVLLPAALVLGRGLGVMVSGDDLATGLGVRVERTRLGLVLIGVALVSVATAAAGPIAFIALAAPQIARRITRTARIGLIPAALMGALLVLASDLLAQRLFAPTQLAVGTVSGSLGGLYLIWLLATEWKRNRG